MNRKLCIFTLSFFLIFLYGCEGNTQKNIILEEIELKKIDSSRLKITNSILYFDEINIGNAGTELELNEWHYGHEAVIDKKSKIFSLRYAIDDAPAPYNEYLSKVLLLKKDLKELPVQSNFILESVYGDENTIWLKGMYRSGRIFYWDVLYLYNIEKDKLIRINDLFKLNSIVIDQITNQYADITAWHNSDHHPLTEKIPEDLNYKNYRIFNDGTFEIR